MKPPLKIRLPLPRFLSAGEVFMGRGSVGALRALGAARVALVVTPGIAAGPAMLTHLRRAIGALAVEVVVAPPGEPVPAALGPALAALTRFAPDWIVAVGGGSAIDAARFLWIGYEHPDLELAQLRRPFALPPLRGRARFAAVPTTAGTGAEVSSAAVIAEPGTGRKLAIVSHELLPDVAVLDPELLIPVPRAALGAAAIDALAHALEGYGSRYANPLADQFAASAVAVLLRDARAAIDDPQNLETRQALQVAALQAGWVQNLKLPGIGHAIAHQLGGLGLPHGGACGLVLVAALAANCAADPRTRERYARLARQLGLDDEAALFAQVARFRDDLGWSGGLAAHLHDGHAALEQATGEIVAGAALDPCAIANPVPASPEFVRHILHHAL
ncbi:MAG: iron-containing alcohol dehydrogenase [Verrucomicrobia bacterium]|nr:iron-containing alcohol dehydrogenase [Verrucomicrobiota bacterium]